jgi:Zn-finger nucleic acid-binding protein
MEAAIMNCPKCEAQMEVVRFEDTEVDRCVRCGGLWFDALEEEELRGRAGAEEIDSGPRWLAATHNVQPRAFCPVDGTLMLRMVETAQPHIWVESCPVCHGTFFDAGEFKDLQEHAVGKLLRRQWRERAP